MDVFGCWLWLKLFCAVAKLSTPGESGGWSGKAIFRVVHLVTSCFFRKIFHLKIFPKANVQFSGRVFQKLLLTRKLFAAEPLVPCIIQKPGTTAVR